MSDNNNQAPKIPYIKSITGGTGIYSKRTFDPNDPKDQINVSFDIFNMMKNLGV